MTAAIDRAEAHLAAQVRPNGRLHAKCSARSVETALYLHFLQGTSFAPQSIPRLRTWCDQYTARPDGGSAATVTKDLGKLFSDLLVRGVLGERGESGATRLTESLSQFAHSSRSRKQILLSVLLAEVGAISFDGLAYSPAEFDFANSQHWAILMMAAARMIYGNRIGDRRFLSSNDLDRIEKAQSPNGSWENHILLTLVTLIALKPGARLPVTIRRGVDFVEKHITSDGGVPFVPDIDIWLTAMGGYLLSGRGTRSATRDKMAEYIAGAQHATGGWGFSEEVRAADVDDTALCHLFLNLHGADRHRDSLRAAERYIRAAQNDDGGFSTYVKGAPSEAEVTAHAVMALAASDRDRLATTRACEWFTRTQMDSGAFPYDWTLSSQYALSQVLLALRLAGYDAAACRQLRQRALKYVLDSQNTDGGWGRFSGRVSTGLSTAYALISLDDQAGYEAAAASRVGHAFLRRQQGPSGEFFSPPDALGPRPLVYEVKTFATLYAYWAMCSYHRG